LNVKLLSESRERSKHNMRETLHQHTHTHSHTKHKHIHTHAHPNAQSMKQDSEVIAPDVYLRNIQFVS
jgi:hypothetical protein